MHHGIKGMKWGVRRYQNEDGSLTDAGRARYGNSTNYSYKDQMGGVSSLVRQGAKSSLYGRKHFAENRVNSLANKEQAARAAGDEKSAAKYERRKEAQSAANANRKAYEDHTDTGKLVAQDILLGKHGAANYRAARARGAGRVRSLLETNAGLTPISTLIKMSGDKKAYGSRLVMSDI